MDIVVIGAGISGSSCAFTLSQVGHNVTVVEKGRGVGGRMATRRMEGARIDHGAQFFTTRDQRVRELNQTWLKEEQVVPWYDQVPGRTDLPTDMRYRGRIGITGPAKSLTRNCNLALNFFAERIVREKKWKIYERDGDGRMIQADHLVITIPSVQMLELFDRSSLDLGIEAMNGLRKIRHTRCLALLGILDRSSQLLYPGAVTHPAENIDWLSDNQTKGISDRPAITLHASAEFSDRNWEVPTEEWGPDLISSAQEVLGAEVISFVSHRWGFAKPLQTFGATHYHQSEIGLTLAGDGFGGERVERAAISGLDAAAAMSEENS
jgi:renalase